MRSIPRDPGSSGPCSTSTWPPGPATTRRRPRREVVVEGESLSAGELDLHHHLYDDGLREFAVTNGLPVPASGHGAWRAAEWPGTRCRRPERCRPGCWCPSAGARTRWSSSRPCATWPRACSPSIPIRWSTELAAEAGLELLVVRRRLDPDLAALHDAGRHERARAHHRHRVADRRGRRLRPRLRHGGHGRRALGQRGDGVGRRRAGQPPVLEEPGVRGAAGRPGAAHRSPPN